MDGSLFADNLTIYISINQRVATRAQQGVTNKLDACAVEGGSIFHKQNGKYDI